MWWKAVFLPLHLRLSFRNTTKQYEALNSHNGWTRNWVQVNRPPRSFDLSDFVGKPVETYNFSLVIFHGIGSLLAVFG
jgi:hypothetical protein